MEWGAGSSRPSTYWRLLKKVEDDPRYDKKKAEYLLKSFVELHPHAIGEKVKICVEHFAAQTLSRLNRTLPPEKKGTMVLDFANEADEIKAAFEPYYEATLLSEATDPNLLYEIQTRLADFPVYTEADVGAFAKVYFDPKATQDRLYAVLGPLVERFLELSKEEQHDFRRQLTDYVRLYAFLAQVLTFADADLEKLYVFVRHLRRLLPADRAELPREVQQNIDMESYRIQQTGSGKIALERRPGVLEPVSTKQGHGVTPEELETLSRIIAELNERFGLNLGPEHRVTLGHFREVLNGLRTATPKCLKSVTLRVTKVYLCTFAIAAIIASS
jgi:type I restriction enzyme R subunit